MPYLQRDLNDMYRQVLAVLPVEFDDIPPDSMGAEAATGLAAAFEIIEQESGEQAGFDGAAQAGTAQRAVDRGNLMLWRSELARTARTIARKKPGFNEHFPPSSDENDQQLLANSRAVAPKAVEFETDFTKLGLEKEFVTSGAARVEAFETSFETTDEALAQRGAAVGEKNQAYKDAAEHFDTLDTYIRNRYRSQPAKLAAWKIASHIKRSAKSDKGGGEENK